MEMFQILTVVVVTLQYTRQYWRNCTLKRGYILELRDLEEFSYDMSSKLWKLVKQSKKEDGTPKTKLIILG